jgi:hypothetical protein
MLDKISDFADSLNAFVGHYTERFSAWYGGLSDTGQAGFLFLAALGIMILIGLFYISRITR